MPRQFSFRGDRLAYSWGIVLLAAIAVRPAVHLRRRHPRPDPALLGRRVRLLHAVADRHGQALEHRPRGRLAAGAPALNAFGAVLTAVVMVVVVSVKFVDGAWLVVVLIPLLVAMMLFIHRQYAASRAQLAVRPDFVDAGPHREERVVVPVPGINRAVVQAINVGRSISDDVRAVYISDDQPRRPRMRDQWERQVPGVPLVLVESPYRALVGPLVAYLDVLDRAWPPDKPAPVTFVVIPEYVARHWWERILYNQSAKRLRTTLLGRPHTVVVNAPYRREDAAAPIGRRRRPPTSDGHGRRGWRLVTGADGRSSVRTRPPGPA